MSKSKSCKFKGQQKSFYLHQNRVASCCRAQATQLDIQHRLDFYLNQWQQERQLLDQGVEIPSCEHCWRDERAGKISYRSSGLDTNIVEIYLSNLCNQMCSYCSPKFSSTWQDSIENLGMFDRISLSAQQNLLVQAPSQNVEYWMDEIDRYIAGCEDQSVVVKILGGEPLMQQRNLEKFLSMNSPKIRTLGIHTNLNPPSDKFLRWLLDNLTASKLRFTISIDSSPDYNHWPRARFDRDQFEHNLGLLTQHAVPRSINAVISVLSVFDLAGFVGWIRQQNLKTTFVKLQNPECLDPTLIPLDFRQQIWNEIKSVNPPEILKEILHVDTRNDSIRLFEQRNYLSQYFERNQLDPQQCPNLLFKEYWNWLAKNTQSVIIKK